MRKKSVLKVCSVSLAFVLLSTTMASAFTTEKQEKVASEAQQTIDLFWKDKIEDAVLEKMKDEEEKIKVFVWYKDINQTSVMQEAESQTGISYASVDTDLEMPDAELLADFAEIYADNFNNQRAYAQYQEEMQDYLQRTESQRAQELQLTDELLEAKREIAKKAYAEKGNEILEELAVTDDEIIFESKYAPMAIVEMTPEEIEEAAKNTEVESIDFYDDNIVGECASDSLDEMKNCNGITAAYQKTGLTGKGVKVGIYDQGAVSIISELPASRFTPIGSQNDNDHATRVARISTGNNGVAPGATVYSINGYDADNKKFNIYDFYACIEKLIDYNVNVVNCSVVWSFNTNQENYRRENIYFSQEKWLDHVASVHNVTFVQGAGNFKSVYTSVMPSPALAYNVITVGAMEDQSSALQTDDKLWEKSLYDHASGCYKPDIVANGRVLKDVGTSYAAPVITGIVALMMELKPALKTHPEYIKAILLASCHRKVIDPVTSQQSESIVSGLTNKQGAGVVDAVAALNIVSKNQYSHATYVGTNINKTISIPYEPFNYASIGLAWLQNNKIVQGNSHTSGSVSVGNLENLNLAVYNNSNLVNSSTKTTSSTEKAYFPLKTSTSYQLRISGSGNQTPVYSGYAWSTMADQACPKGDVNLDLNVSLADAQLALKYIQSSASLNLLQKYLMDYNKDGALNNTDVQLIQNQALGIN